MEYVILGLLKLKDLTIYDFRKILLETVSPFYSASFGSIRSALKKLHLNRQIGFYEIVENGCGKKLYKITDTGNIHFKKWISIRTC